MKNHDSFEEEQQLPLYLENIINMTLYLKRKPFKMFPKEPHQANDY